MIVHFVCAGNTYRSRLAEAYFNSLNIKNYRAISSGTQANKGHHIQISPYTEIILKNYGIDKYASKHKTQLTQERLNEANITICVNRDVYSDCLEANLNMPRRTYIWDIADVKDFDKAEIEIANHQLPSEADRTFNLIKNHVDELVKFLNRPTPNKLVDVLDEKGNPTGETSNIRTVHDNGLIHGGVHVGLYSKDGKIVIEKRSENIVFNAGRWDVSMGGVIDAGETPDQALVREVSEELGINLDINSAEEIFVIESNRYLPHYGYHNHNFTHTYIAEVPNNISFKIQEEEVAEAKLVSIADAEKLNSGGLENMKVIPSYSYNQRIIDAIKRKLNLSLKTT